MKQENQPIAFTRAEVLRALRLVLSESEANALLDSIEADSSDETQGLAWSNDTLALLSLLSDDHNARVEAYRRELTEGRIDAASEQAFVRRREEFRQTLK